MVVIRLAPLLAAAITLTGCGAVDRATDPAPPGRGESVPAIVLNAVDRDLNPLRAWAQTRASKHGIPERALQAYGFATVVMAKAQPDCHLGWTTLAGIASVESNHARHGGATVAANGLVRPPIRGVPLNGTAGNAVITDPDGTNRAGRTVYARAMGPFQFIPDTWKRWGIRANADYQSISPALEAGKPVSSKDLSGSPDNLDDAALAAGRYLCASGGDLATAAGWRRAIFAYNHSDEYVGQVRSAATRYDK